MCEDSIWMLGVKRPVARWEFKNSLHSTIRLLAPWLQMQKLAQSTSLAFNVAQSRCVQSLTVCHFEPKKWHTL
jgi:hypothetical protein